MKPGTTNKGLFFSENNAKPQQDRNIWLLRFKFKFKKCKNIKLTSNQSEMLNIQMKI